MATTGFWPVKGRLKDVIEYAENPNKTIDKKYLDDDLAAALSYVEDASKTDSTMYVSGINCPKKRACEQMMNTKRRYGKLGGNVAYHAYQSFRTGEVTPEEAHRIGIETAKRMWGDEYEIVVTTHLNTDNIHNHIVLNSVSFRTGRKFENHISDHYKLREISDEVCREYGKSVLENAQFYKNDKKAYWVRKSGQLPHKDILRRDVDEALANTISPLDFEAYLQSLGYKFVRNFRYELPSVIAPDWQKPVRLSSLGRNYTKEAIFKQFDEQRTIGYAMSFDTPRPLPRRKPLIMLIRKFEAKYQPDIITSFFEIIIAIAKICTGSNVQKQENMPLSPDFRAEIKSLDRTLEEYRFLCERNIESAEDFLTCKAEIVEKIESLEAKRNQIRNQIRRAKTPEDDLKLKEQSREITKKLTPLRKQLKICERIENKVPRLRALIEQEMQMESGRYDYKYRQQNSKERSYTR